MLDDILYQRFPQHLISLIRTEADELTYPLHILIRYELEKEMINGNIDFDVLDEMWNNKYEEYLGIRYLDQMLDDILYQRFPQHLIERHIDEYVRRFI